MFRREFQEDSDFSVKKYYRRRTIKKKRNKSKFINSQSQLQQTTGKWNLQQTKLYVDFLKEAKNVINDFKYRREKKIFKQMSQYVKTRTPDQCRSHHQKVQKLHNNIQDIITFYDRKVMFGGSKRTKIQSNIVLIRGFEKEQKTTCLIDSEDFYQTRIENEKLIIVINQDQIEQY